MNPKNLKKEKENAKIKKRNVGKKKRKLNNGTELNDEEENDQIEMEKPKSHLSIGGIRKIIEVDILLKRNPIKHMKKFGTINCGLCMRERLAILSALRIDDLNDKNVN